jgi:hypothetical protein
MEVGMDRRWGEDVKQEEDTGKRMRRMGHRLASEDIHWTGIQMDWMDRQGPAGVGSRRIGEREDMRLTGEGMGRDMRRVVVDHVELMGHRQILWRADCQDFLGRSVGDIPVMRAAGESCNGVVDVGNRAVRVAVDMGVVLVGIHVRVDPEGIHARVVLVGIHLGHVLEGIHVGDVHAGVRDGV